MTQCTRIAIAVAAATVSLLWTGTAQAQRSYPYRPSRPVLSPYIQYGRRDTAGLPAYLAFVRPQEESQAFQTYLRSYVRRNDRRYAELSREELRLRQEVAPSGVGPELHLRSGTPTSSAAVPATFLNLSPYYSGFTPTGRR